MLRNVHEFLRDKRLSRLDKDPKLIDYLHKLGASSSPSYVYQQIAAEYSLPVSPAVSSAVDKIATAIRKELTSTALSEAEQLSLFAKPKQKKYLVHVAVGALAVAAVAVLIHYVRQKKKYGELYTIKDLIKDILSFVWKAISGFIKTLSNEFIRFVTQAFVVGLIALILLKVIPDVEDPEKLPTFVRWAYYTLKSNVKRQEREALRTS